MTSEEYLTIGEVAERLSIFLLRAIEGTARFSLSTQSLSPVFLVDLLLGFRIGLDRIALRADEFQRPWLGFVARLNQGYLNSFRQPRSEPHVENSSNDAPTADGLLFNNGRA